MGLPGTSRTDLCYCSLVLPLGQLDRITGDEILICDA